VSHCIINIIELGCYYIVRKGEIFSSDCSVQTLSMCLITDLTCQGQVHRVPPDLGPAPPSPQAAPKHGA